MYERLFYVRKRWYLCACCQWLNYRQKPPSSRRLKHTIRIIAKQCEIKNSFYPGGQIAKPYWLKERHQWNCRPQVANALRSKFQAILRRRTNCKQVVGRWCSTPSQTFNLCHKCLKEIHFTPSLHNKCCPTSLPSAVVTTREGDIDWDLQDCETDAAEQILGVIMTTNCWI